MRVDTHNVLQPAVLSLDCPVSGQTKPVVEVRFSVKLLVSSLTMHYWAGLYRLCNYTVRRWLWWPSRLRAGVHMWSRHGKTNGSLIKYYQVITAPRYMRSHIISSQTASTLLHVIAHLVAAWFCLSFLINADSSGRGLWLILICSWDINWTQVHSVGGCVCCRVWGQEDG